VFTEEKGFVAEASDSVIETDRILWVGRGAVSSKLFEGMNQTDLEGGGMKICAVIRGQRADVPMEIGKGRDALGGGHGIPVLLGIVFVHVDRVQFDAALCHFGADGGISFVFVEHLMDEGAEFRREARYFGGWTASPTGREWGYE
jgi:hypothetical protein